MRSAHTKVSTLVAGVLLATVAGCAEQSQPGGTSPPAQSTLTVEEAQAALLREGDLPAGWTTDHENVTDEFGTEGEETTPAECLSFFLYEAEDEPLHEASVQLYPPDDDLTFQHSVAVHDAPAVSRLDRMAALLDDCARFTEPRETGDAIEFQLSPLAYPELGDRTLAVDVVVTTDDETGYQRRVYVAVGNTVVAMTAARFVPASADEPAPATAQAVLEPTDQQLADLLTAALDKLAQVGA